MGYRVAIFVEVLPSQMAPSSQELSFTRTKPRKKVLGFQENSSNVTLKVGFLWNVF